MQWPGLSIKLNPLQNYGIMNLQLDEPTVRRLTLGADLDLGLAEVAMTTVEAFIAVVAGLADREGYAEGCAVRHNFRIE